LPIPVFQQIDELHHATVTMQQPLWSDFYIYRNEDANETCVSSMEAHRCNFFQVSIDRQSGYKLCHNSQAIQTANNTIYFTTADTLISWKPSNNEKTWQGYNINFKHDFLSAGINNYNFRKEFPFLHTQQITNMQLPAGHEHIYELCERMIHEHQSPARDIHIIRHYLYVLLYTIRRMYAQQHPLPGNNNLSREAELASRFEELMNQHFLEYKSIDAYASKLFISPKYLSQVTKNVYGKTAKEMILHRTAEEAKALLVQTNNTLNQIAEQLTFTDTSNFIKFFRRLTGQGPSEYRRLRSF
jgi:AraC family transcriptional regulator, transcriptional activator of pobA